MLKCELLFYIMNDMHGAIFGNWYCHHVEFTVILMMQPSLHGT